MSDHKSRTRTINNGHHKIMKNYLTATARKEEKKVMQLKKVFSSRVRRGIFFSVKNDVKSHKLKAKKRRIFI